MRSFKKETSVFDKWIEDNEKIYKQCIEIDSQYWKIARFVKDEEDQANIYKVLLDNFPILKNNFLYVASTSNFPSITLNEMTAYAKTTNIFDKNLTMPTLDRLFIAANVDLNGNGDAGSNSLCRYEFLELIVRIANEKYRKPKLANSVAESVQMLIDQNIKPNSYESQWQGFRDKSLWTIDVNDIFEANLQNLRKIYKIYVSRGSLSKKLITVSDVVDMFMHQAKFNFTEADIEFFAGMSKMTVTDEGKFESKYS